MSPIPPPRSYLRGISVHFRQCEIILKLWFFNFMFDSITLFYRNGQKNETFLFLDQKNLEISMISEDYFKKFVQYLTSTFSNFYSNLEYFHVENEDFEILESILKFRNEKLSINFLNLKNTKFSFFEYLKPVERVNLEMENMDFRAFFGLDFWKLSDDDVKWNIIVEELGYDDMVEIRKAFSTSSTPRNLSIYYRFIDFQQIDNLFGRPIQNSQNEIFRIQKFSENSFIKTTVLENNTIVFHFNGSKEIASKPQIAFENSLIMEKILLYLKCFDIQRLRKLSKSIRNCIDTLKPDPKIKKLSIIIDNLDSLKMDISLEKYHSMTIYYGRNPKGYGSFVNRKLLSLNFEKVFSTDLESILKNQKSEMVELMFSFPYYSYLKDEENGIWRDDADYGMLEETTTQFLKEWKQIFKLRPLKLSTKKLKMEVFNECQIWEILQFLDEKSIKSIEIGYPYGKNLDFKSMKIEKISKLDQWKMADELIISDRTTVSTVIHEMDIFHFSKVFVMVETISLDEFRFLKEKLLGHPNLEKFKFNFKIPNLELELLSPPYSKSRNIITWYFHFPSNTHSLCITYYVSRTIVFTCVPISATPRNIFY